MKNSIFSRLLLGTVSLTALIFSGCDGYVAPAWYNVYGGYCGSGAPSPGCNFFADGLKIVAGEDPYYGSSILSFGTWNYYNSYGIPSSFYGWAWQSPTGIIYNEFGHALNSDTESESRDLIGTAAEVEKQVVTQVGKNFAKEHALSEDTGIKIASTLNDWATLSKKRARTDQDVADFSKRLYGISVNQAKTAFDQAKQGNMEGLEAANVDVADHWGTKPETAKVILQEWFKDQISKVDHR